MIDDIQPLYLKRLNEALQAVSSTRYVAPEGHREAIEGMEDNLVALMDEAAADLGLSEEEYELVRMGIYDELEDRSG